MSGTGVSGQVNWLRKRSDREKLEWCIPGRNPRPLAHTEPLVESGITLTQAQSVPSSRLGVLFQIDGGRSRRALASRHFRTQDELTSGRLRHFRSLQTHGFDSKLNRKVQFATAENLEIYRACFGFFQPHARATSITGKSFVKETRLH